MSPGSSVKGKKSGIHEDVKRGQQQPSSQNDDQDDILPCDSISNISSGKQGSKSSVFTTSSARLKTEAEIAALLGRQSVLKEKHSLEEQEEKLRQQKEELQLKADIAASMAKVNVLRTSGSGVRSAASHRSDGMESYFKKKGKAVEA